MIVTIERNLLSTWAVRPFIGFGLGYYSWNLDVEQDELEKATDGADLGAVLALGASWRASPRLSVSADFAYHHVYDEFNEPLISALVGASWHFDLF